MRRAAVLTVFAIVAACSSEEQLNPQPLPPQDPQEGAERNGDQTGVGGSASLGNCTGTCCEKPAEGSACDATQDTTCSWAVTCPTGLVLPYEITCTNGTWALTNGCPAEGQTDARGCPASNPVNGTPCNLTSGTFQCGYVLECTGYRKSVQATCSGSTWVATPLGVCD